MQELTSEQLTKEMKTFEGFCNKAQSDLCLYIEGCSDLQLKEKLEKRYNQFEEMINFITTDTKFIGAPASTKYHLCIPYGLLVHSNSVTKIGLRLNNTLNVNAPIYKVITTFLFHDLGKHNQYSKNEPTEKQKAAGFGANPPYSFVKQDIYNRHESKSLWLISKYLDLDEDEWSAIMYHNAPWDGDLKLMFETNKLMTMLQYADYWSCLYCEQR